MNPHELCIQSSHFSRPQLAHLNHPKPECLPSQPALTIAKSNDHVKATRIQFNILSHQPGDRLVTLCPKGGYVSLKSNWYIYTYIYYIYTYTYIYMYTHTHIYIYYWYHHFPHIFRVQQAILHFPCSHGHKLGTSIFQQTQIGHGNLFCPGFNYECHHCTWRAWHLRQPRRPVLPWLFKRHAQQTHPSHFNIISATFSTSRGWTREMVIQLLRGSIHCLHQTSNQLVLFGPRVVPCLFSPFFSIAQWIQWMMGFKPQEPYIVSTTLCQLLYRRCAEDFRRSNEAQQKTPRRLASPGHPKLDLQYNSSQKESKLCLHSIPHHLSISLISKHR